MAVGTDPANVVVHSMEFDTTFQDDILKGFEDKKKEKVYQFGSGTIIGYQLQYW